MLVRRRPASSVITVRGSLTRMREELDQVIDTSRPLSRRSFAMWGAAGLLATGIGSLTLGQVSAREPEPGDDRGGDATTSASRVRLGDGACRVSNGHVARMSRERARGLAPAFHLLARSP